MNDPSQLDTAIAEVFEQGDQVQQIEQYGTSTWALTVRVDVEHANGEPHSYFVKILKTDDAAERVLGEYTSMLEIYKTMPNLAPRPRGHGQCAQDPTSFFFACDYIPIGQELPDPEELGRKIAELHLKSESPTGQFGFPVTTYDGKLPHPTSWDSNWTTFYHRLMRETYELDVQVNGLWKELDDVMRIVLDRLIPRLLDPLTSNGRSIKPCLIHGDLWESNIGTDEETDEIYIFDACSYYAHHEKELGIWRVDYHQMKDENYRRAYHQHYPPSEPEDEADDRNRLYCADILLMNSAHFPGAQTRVQALNDLTYLVNKYVTGAEATAAPSEGTATLASHHEESFHLEEATPRVVV